MTILELGAIGEFVGSLAVIATLVYLALQIRQNTASNRVAAKLETTRQYADYIDFLLLNQGFLELNMKGMSGEELSPDESMRFFMMLSKAFWYFASMHYQYRMGAMSADEWVQSASTIERYCSSPAVRHWWQDERQRYGLEFGRYVDGLIDLSNRADRHWNAPGQEARAVAGAGQGT
jgi:hypothetical protein